MKAEDDLDRKIVKHICSGIYSYEELANLCDVSRNTIYRRIANLEKEGVIERRIMAYPDFERLNLSAVIFGMNVSPRDLDKTVDFLKGQIKVKLVWKTYGAHDIICVIICDKREVGECIQNMKKALEELDITVLQMDSSTSISWERTDLSPY
ncbi:MAG: Lrp/AsnC family transcriptional regulator [Candidatus Hodarchaeota archaeon]